MNRSSPRPAIVLSAAVATGMACALILKWADGSSVAQAAIQAPPAVTRAADGHYWADALVEGRSMRMLVDTGASVVTLDRDHAESIGVHVAARDFTRQVQTASGPIKAAPVVLSSLMVGGVKIEQVEALIIDTALPAPLLGMSYLGRLQSFEAGADGLRFKG